MKSGSQADCVQTVLVVDDDPEWLDFLSRTIGAQYPVLCASNGEDAVRRAQNACPDVIILDVMMYGGRDGFSTYSELQNDPRTQDIPVLMLSEVNLKTGLDFGAEEMNRYLGKAPAAFLEKPISANRLLNAVRKALGKEILVATDGASLSSQWHGQRARIWGALIHETLSSCRTCLRRSGFGRQANRQAARP